MALSIIRSPVRSVGAFARGASSDSPAAGYYKRQLDTMLDKRQLDTMLDKRQLETTLDKRRFETTLDDTAGPVSHRRRARTFTRVSCAPS
jgi:hypothetical protein